MEGSFMLNADIANIFRRMALYLTMRDVPFKPRAYERAAESIITFPKDITVLYRTEGVKGLSNIPGVGAGIAQHIKDYITTGHIGEFERLKKEIPIALDEFDGIEGLGPKTLYSLYTKLKIRRLVDLEKALHRGTIADMPHFGKKSQEKIARAVAFRKKTHGRYLLSDAFASAQGVVDALSRIKGVRHAVIAGSLRRMQETVGDIDIVVSAKDTRAVMDALIALPDVGQVIAHGPTKTFVRLKNGMEVDVRAVPNEVFGAALQYFTGDKHHNVLIRTLAKKKGYTLSEYGLFRKKRLIAADTEEDVYTALDLTYIPPELRTASGEIEAARDNSLPRLLSYTDLRGDLQVQTSWTDGSASIVEMATAAQQHGLSYIAITDHTRALTIASGLDERALKRQYAEIDQLNARYRRGKKSFTLLKSAELNILKDGSFDISDGVLKRMDIVCASVHSHFSMSEEEMTSRIITALKHPLLNVLFHPTGRLIQRRQAYQVDMGKVIRAARLYGVVLEVNAHPERLDLCDSTIRMARDAGVKLVINSDAHAPSHFSYLRYGIGQVRRGWGRRADVLNTLPYMRLLEAFKKLKIRKRL